eukprot:Clim_evm26s210 gene=Clim_evmTU26s210
MALAELVTMCVAMLIGSYVVGVIPLCLTIGQDKLKSLTSWGTGVLIGTAFAVIIPEALAVLQGDDAGHTHNSPGGTFQAVEWFAVGGAGGEGKNVEGLEAHASKAGHSAIGMSLILGFLMMLYIDVLFGNPHESEVKSGTIAVIGLIVHAAADGLALGVASQVEQSTMELFVFFAIMMHKGPAALGLTTTLMMHNLGEKAIKYYLVLFSSAAPASAIATYSLCQVLEQDFLDSSDFVGLALLFSAGTFIYVAAVHVLPEVLHDDSQRSKATLAFITAGAMLPVAFSSMHVH